MRLISNDFCTQLASEDKGIKNFEGKFQILTRKTVFFSVFSSVHGRTVSVTKLSAMKTHDINAKMTINTLQIYYENVIFFDFFKQNFFGGLKMPKISIFNYSAKDFHHILVPKVIFSKIFLKFAGSRFTFVLAFLSKAGI